MDMNIQVKPVNLPEVMDRFKRLPDALKEGIRKGAERGLSALETRVRANTHVKWRSGGSGLSGRLTSFSEIGTDQWLRAAIGFRKTKRFPYEMSQEFGAKAKPGKAMAIPLTDKARRVQSPREMKNLVFIKKGKNPILAEKKPRSFAPQFVLVKSIPARLKFRETIEQNVAMLSEEIVRGAQEAQAAI